MAQPKTATVIRQLGLSQTLAEKADKRAAQLGLSTPEYIRHLIVQDNEDRLGDRPHLSEQTEQRYFKDLIEFFQSEKDHPTPGATSAEELVKQLEQV